jgi:hypothetical protein
MGITPSKKENQNTFNIVTVDSDMSMEKPQSRPENKFVMDKIIGKFLFIYDLENKIKKEEEGRWYIIENSTEIELPTQVSDYLEKAYKIGAARSVISSGCHLDLFKTHQLNKEIPSIKSPVIRKVVAIKEEKSNKQASREARDEIFFTGSDIKNIDMTELTKQKPDFLMIPPLIINWYFRTIDIFNDLSYLNKIKCIFQLAEIGIKNLGVLLNQENQANEITRIIMKDIDKVQDVEILLNRVIYTYTMESFLYKVLNKSLRENDLTYIDNLGPFGFLVYEFIRYKQMYSVLELINDKSVEHIDTVWRSLNIPEEMLSLYHPKICTYLIWYSFTSTSRDEKTAKDICLKSKHNTLFKILIEKNIFCQTVNIRELSCFKKEDEILLQVASVLEIVDHKIENGIHVITLKLIPNQQICQSFTIIKNQFNLLNNKWKCESLEYTDQDNFLIEYNFLEGKKECRVGDYIINYEKSVQYHHENKTTVMPVKRVTNFSSENLSFSYFKTLINENVGKILSPIILFWYSKFVLKNRCSYLEKWTHMLDLIIDGILEESKTISSKKGEEYANNLTCTALESNYSRIQIFKELIKIYCDENFIYDIVNQAMTNHDFSKVDTLGPFCFLFNELIAYYDTLKIFGYKGKVYASKYLDDESLDYYIQNLGQNVYWPSFSSTSKNKIAAEMLEKKKEKNVAIFEIDLDSRGLDVKKLAHSLKNSNSFIHNHNESVFSEHEEKVIIRAGIPLKVQNFKKENDLIYFYLSTFAY